MMPAPLEFRVISLDSIWQYVELFESCFSKAKMSAAYIEWLYFKNPLGNVIGFDAIHKNRIVAHYACIPTCVSGIRNNALLSVNTATAPEFQGQGLFKLLAEKTYIKAQEMNYSCIIGVANQNSINAFIRHLGFDHLGNLDLRLGFLNRVRSGSRVYTREDLEWRCNSVQNGFMHKDFSGDYSMVTAKVMKGLKVRALVPTSNIETSRMSVRKIGWTIDWRIGKKPFVFLPKKFKPSPLALIFKSLDGTSPAVLKSWSFPDFDVF